MKSKNLLFITLLSLTSIALTSCNDISMAVKSKGEEVSALEWSKSYIHSYDSNLSFFFDIVNAENDLPSYSYKYINQTTTKNVRTAIEDGNSSKENADQKTTQTGAFDSANNTYKTKEEITNKKKTPEGLTYSSTQESYQYQKSQNTVCIFDLVEKTYKKQDIVDSVSTFAKADPLLNNVYLTISSVYALLKLSGDSFGTDEMYKNDQFYIKGNVFTVKTTSQYVDTLNDTSRYSSIEGEVEYTRQYIFENSYITITRFTKYKNCSYTDLNSEYKYSVQQESGETITFKNKGTVSKVYTEDFTYVE